VIDLILGPFSDPMVLMIDGDDYSLSRARSKICWAAKLH
jgi:hypothetical protein